ncbi:MAG: GIY-YIG nuclease family protein [Dehalobacterium sp.]
MDRKRELKLQYKQRKPEMGVFIIRCKINNKCYIQTARDFRAGINGAKARLGGGLHPYIELQKEWNEFGGENFFIDILETLEYDKDESKTDYTEDLALLQMIWEEKLSKENMVFYKKRI